MSDDDGNIKPEWSIDYKDLEFGELIGKGNFGKVYRGELFGTDVAIKELLQTDDDEENKKYTDREVSMLTGVRHPNVVNFMGVAKRMKKGNEIYYLVTEWLPGGNLRKLIKDQAQVLTWKRRIEFARDTALAMNYLHQKQIIHRDLKSANLMLAADGSLKVCDFGLARRKNTKKSGLMTMAGTEEWMAPEIIVGDEYDEKCDVFSFGVVLYELITRQKPLPRGPATFFEFNLKDWNKNVPPDCPRKFAELALKCVDYYGKNRPSFTEIVRELKALVQSEELQKDASVLLSPRKLTDSPLKSSGEQRREEVKRNMKKRLMEAEKHLKGSDNEQREEDDPQDLSLRKSKENAEKERKEKEEKERKEREERELKQLREEVEKKEREDELKKSENKKKGDNEKKAKKPKEKKKGGGAKSSPVTKKKERKESSEEDKNATPVKTKKNGKAKKDNDEGSGDEKSAEALLSKYYSRHAAAATTTTDEPTTKKEKRKSWQSIFHGKDVTTPKKEDKKPKKKEKGGGKSKPNKDL